MDSTDSLEMHCEQPGLWLIEGVQVRRVKRDRWKIEWEPGETWSTVETFREAKQRIVDCINAGTL